MPRLVNRTPRYRKHKGSGQAVVHIDGREIYLGPHGPARRKRAFDRVVAEWLANGRHAPLSPADDLTVVELIARYWAFAEQYHKPAPGCSDGELDGIRAVLRIVKRLYGDTSVSRFGPLSLRAVRDAMVALGWCRSYTNAQVNRVRRLFKWGVEREMVPSSVLHGLQAVIGLREGQVRGEGDRAGGAGRGRRG